MDVSTCNESDALQISPDHHSLLHSFFPPLTLNAVSFTTKSHYTMKQLLDADGINIPDPY